MRSVVRRYPHGYKKTRRASALPCGSATRRRPAQRSATSTQADFEAQCIHRWRVKLVVWNFFEAGEGKVCLCLVALRAKATLPVTDNCNRARIDRAFVTSILLSFRGR
jgi:hypothetical protein